MPTVTYMETGTFSVPVGVTEIDVVVVGGCGGRANVNYLGGQPGGYGGNVRCSIIGLTVVDLLITVGEKGPDSVRACSGGGGSSAISHGNTIYVISGGGGGSSDGGISRYFGKGGDACYNFTADGGNGTNVPSNFPGAPPGEGGSDGVGGLGGDSGDNGSDGFGGYGGGGGFFGSVTGGSGFTTTSTNGYGGNGGYGGSGGGGYGGGGGGGYGGGGGGSGTENEGDYHSGGGGAGGSYVNPQFTINALFSPHTELTDGKIIITYEEPIPVPCLLSTSWILTPTAYKPIDEIKSGDTVISAFSRQPKTVLHCGYMVVDIEALPETNMPKVIPRGHFRHDIPSRDVYISGHHRVICPISDNNDHFGIQTFKLGDFKNLNTGEVLVLTGKNEARYYHLEVEGGKDAVFCDGLPVETLEKGEWNDIFIEN